MLGKPDIERGRANTTGCTSEARAWSAGSLLQCPVSAHAEHNHRGR